MNIMQLRYALEIEQAGGITKAANNLFMGQPNLSKALRDLEEEVGYGIFKRMARGMVPTQNGRVFLVLARRVIDRMNDLEALTSPSHVDPLSFYISAPHSAYITKAFTQWLTALNHDASVEVGFKRTGMYETVQNVFEGESNIGIIRFPCLPEMSEAPLLRGKGLEYQTLWEFDSLLTYQKNCMLSTIAQPTYEDLAVYIEIAREGMPLTPLNMAGIKKGPNHMGSVLLDEDDCPLDVLSQLTRAYLWEAPVPQNTMDNMHLEQKVCAFPTPRYKDILLYRKEYALTPSDSLFIEKLYAVRDELLCALPGNS